MDITYWWLINDIIKYVKIIVSIIKVIYMW